MVSGLLGRRMMGIYLTAGIGCSLFLGFMTDQLYSMLQISPVATAGQARELIPEPIKIVAAFVPMGQMSPALKHIRFRKTADKTV